MSQLEPAQSPRSESSYQSMSDVLTSELLRENPYKKAKASVPSKQAHERLEVHTDSSQSSMPASFSYYQYSAFDGSEGSPEPVEAPTIIENVEEPRAPEPPKKEELTPPRSFNSYQSKKGKVIQHNARNSLRSGPLHQVPVMTPPRGYPARDQSSHNTSSVYSIHRDISNSMGSQATIFSVREEQQSNRSKTRLRRGMLRRRPTKAGAGNGKDSSGLFRRKAVRSKDGSLGYRLRLRLRKMAAKLRAMKHWPRKIRNFATKKKATQKVTMERSSKSQRSRNNSKAMAISAPLKNPYLGRETGASKVEGLTDDLKNMAGHGTLTLSGEKTVTSPENSAAADITPTKVRREDGKWTQLSRYISEQQELTVSSQSKPYESVAALSESNGPPPPPHTVSASFEKQRVQGLWKHYLVCVLTQRIQLRQEIAMFQALAAGQSVPSLFKGSPEVASSHNASIIRGESDKGTEASIIDEYVQHSKPSERNIEIETIDDEDDSVSFISVSDSILSDNDAVSLPDEVTDWEEEDPTVTKLNQTLNRRSVLGEMLNYDSDDASSDSGSSLDLVSNAQSATDSAIFKRYGTLRRKNTTKSSTPARESSVMKTPMSPAPVTPPPNAPALETSSPADTSGSLPRSAGIHHDLSSASLF